MEQVTSEVEPWTHHRHLKYTLNHESYPNPNKWKNIFCSHKDALQHDAATPQFFIHVFKKFEFVTHNLPASTKHPRLLNVALNGMILQDGSQTRYGNRDDAHHYQKGVQPRTPMAISLVLWRPEIKLSPIFMTGSGTRPNAWHQNTLLGWLAFVIASISVKLNCSALYK